MAGATRVFAEETRAGSVHLIAAPGLVQAYSKALRAFGLTPGVIDGGSASVAGLGEIFRLSQIAGARRVAG